MPDCTWIRESETTVRCTQCSQPITFTGDESKLHVVCATITEPVKLEAQGLGDRVAYAFELIGITQDRLERWLGAPCSNCNERRRKLNKLGWWADKILDGCIEDAKKRFQELLS